MTERPNILIACIGNIFLGDDAFGVHVARRLARESFPQNVRVVDFGIRGIDLAYALLDGVDLAILVDAVPHGRQPGTVSVIEPELPDAAIARDNPQLAQGHSLTPANVLALVAALGGEIGEVLIVGCEPVPLDVFAEMQLELSPSVAGAIEPAVQIVKSLVAEHSQTKTQEVA